MSTERDRALNRARVARWRAAHLERARKQWRDYYLRARKTLLLRQKARRCGIDPELLAGGA